jgi:hypothetical protein
MKYILTIFTLLFMQPAFSNSIEDFLTIMPEGSYRGRVTSPSPGDVYCDVNVQMKEAHLEIMVTQNNLTKIQLFLGSEDVISDGSIPFYYEQRLNIPVDHTRIVKAGPCSSSQRCGVVYISDRSSGPIDSDYHSTVSCIVKY